jgi:predicted restriction endonuclease
MSKDLAYYEREFASLNTNRSSGHSKPHKVCLLLGVAELIERDLVTANRIYLNEDLKRSFRHYFNQFRHGNDKNDPSQPFFYLQSSGFWHHQPKPGSREEYLRRIDNREHGGPGVVARLIDYAYLDAELFNYLQSAVSRTVLTAALLENIEDLGERFQRWALAVGKSEKTVKNYVGAIRGSISSWVNAAGLTNRSIFQINSYEDYYALAEQAKEIDKFEVRDSKGKGMYSAALNLYGDFLADTTQYEVVEDIERISRDAQLEQTEKAVLVSARIGQGHFRQSLLDKWGRCVVTGFQDPRFLIASHIKPWRAADNEERLDPFNGLLLLPNLDKAFDLGYISFEPCGKIRISDQLENGKKLGIRHDQHLQVDISQQHEPYLDYHRNSVFKC